MFSNLVTETCSETKTPNKAGIKNQEVPPYAREPSKKASQFVKLFQHMNSVSTKKRFT